MDNFEDQELGGLPILKKETSSQEQELGGLPVLKKKEPTPLGSSVTPLPSQDKFQQGLKFAQQGFKMPSADVQRQKKEQGYLLNTVSSLDRGFYKNLVGNPIKGLGTLLQGTTSKVIGGSGKGFVSEALIDFGDYFNKTIDELAPQDEEFKNSLTDQFAQAMGQFGSLVLTGGMAGGGAKAPALVSQALPKGAVGVGGAAAKGIATELASPVSISAGLSMGQSEFERAKQYGADDNQAFEAFYKNAAVGSILEKIPTMQFLKRFNQSTGGGVANFIKTKGVAGITGGLEEMTTEVLQQIYANKTAKDIYNINQEIFEGVGESGGIGFGVGFLINAMGANARLLKRQGKKDDAKLIEDQVKSFETKLEQETKQADQDKIKINNIADKLESNQLVPLEDIEFYEANKEKVDKTLAARKIEAEATAPAVIMPEENVAPEVVEPTRPAVIMPDENVAAETTVISPEQQAKGAAVVMPEANAAPKVVETVVTEEEVKPTEVKVKPEVKSKLEEFKTKFAPQPKTLSGRGLQAAETRNIKKEASKVQPKDARGFALSWLANSNENISSDSLNKLLGSFRASLNTGRTTKTQEVSVRDYVNNKGETIDTIVDNIWNNLPEGLEDRITTMDIKDELEALISEYPTRKDAAAALVEYGQGEQAATLEDLQAKYEERKGLPEEIEAEQGAFEGGFEGQFEGGFTPFEEDIDIEGMEEAPFAVQEAAPEEVTAMQDIVKDYINEGTTSLSEIKKAITKELGYNTRKLRQTIEDAYNEYTKTQEAAPKDVVGGVVGRIGNALKKMFGKDAQKPFIAKDSKAMQAKLDEIREDVKFQIAGGFRSANDMPIGYRYDTDKLARERFDIPKLKKIGEGSDRVVFDLGDGNVLKIAKNSRGLEQNIYEGDYYLAGSILPDIIERGVNYVVVEKIDQAIKRTIDLGIVNVNIETDKKEIGKLNDLLKQLKQFTQKDFDNKTPELQQVLEDNGLSDIMNYDVIWNDFTAKRNWGLKNGEPLHLDGGTFGGVDMLNRDKKDKSWENIFQQIYQNSKNAKIENKDADKFTKFMATPDAEILGFTYNNRMYLNGSALNPNTPIHEAGHIWVEWTKTNDPKIYAKGMELVKDSPYYKKAKESKFYQEQANKLPENQREDYYSNEALAMAIGDKGAQFVVESKREAFKDWLKTLWNKIKSLTGFKDLTEEQFQNLTFEEFSKMAVKEVLGVENDLDKFQAARSIKKKKDFVKSKVKGEANKNAIDDFEVDDMIKLIKADYDLQTLKNIKDAIQKRSAEEVLPSKPSKTREPRGERKRVEPGIEGDESTKEGEEAPTEGVEKGWDGAITIAANEERRQLLGLPEYQRERESFEQWTNDAIKAINKGYDVEKLLDKMAKGYSPTPVENQIRKIYVAKLKSDYDKNPSAELEKKLIRYTELNDLANSTAGRQLRSIADVAEPRETLADFVVAKMKAIGVDELTEKQRKEVEKQYEEIKKKEAESQAKFESNDELNAKLLAEDVVKKEKKERKPYQKTKDYKSARSSILEAIREKLKKARSGEELTFVPVPYAKELIAISPDVSKLMKLYVEEGVDNLAEIVSKIYVDLRNEVDGLVEKDIFDLIAGRYAQQRPVLSEAQVKRAELKKEAELIAKIEDVLAGKEPVQEKAKIERNQRLTELRNQLKDLKKESGYYDLSKLESLKEKNNQKIQELDEKIKNEEFEKELKAPSFLENPEFRKKYPKEYDAYLNSVIELSDKQHEFELALARDEMKKTPLVTKIFKKWIPEVGNTIKALLSTIDDSFIFVQLGPAILKNPLLLPKVLNEQRKVIFNEGKFRKEIAALHEDKELWNIIQKSGLDILDPKSLRDKLREESMGGTNLLEREIGVGKLKVVPAKFINAPFERIATSAGNYVRTKMFLQKIAELEKQGKTIENSEKDYQDVARVINEMTGRGKLHKKLEGKGDLISAFLWSPKMLASTINLLGLGDVGNFVLGGKKGYYGSLSPEMRKYAAGQFAGAIGMGALIMAAFALDDEFEVDYDPRSVTFGQIKHTPSGDAWNIFGRFTSVVRYVTLMATGIKYIRSEAVPVDYGKETYKFIRGKAAPAPGLATDAILRQKFSGEPFDYRDLPKEALTPLAVRDIKDAMIEDGTMGLLTKGLPAFMGIKVSTEKMYNQSKQPLEDVIKKHARTEAYTLKIELKDPKTNEIATDKQYADYVKKRDELITEKITELYNGYVITDSPKPVPFVSLEAEDANKEITRVKTEATKEAKEAVFGKKKKTFTERLIDRKKRMFRR